MNKKKLFWFSLAIGLLTLGVGVGIFTLWWAARAWFAIDFSSLEAYGFLWIIVSVPLALTGLITSIIVLVDNTGRQLRLALIPLILILLNVPTVYIILDLQSMISERVYFKIINESGHDLTSAKLNSNSIKSNLGALADGESTVNYYTPTYLSREFDSVPEIEEINLELSTTTDKYELLMPFSMKGWCQRIFITDSLTLNY